MAIDSLLIPTHCNTSILKLGWTDLLIGWQWVELNRRVFQRFPRYLMPIGIIWRWWCRVCLSDFILSIKSAWCADTLWEARLVLIDPAVLFDWKVTVDDIVPGVLVLARPHLSTLQRVDTHRLIKIATLVEDLLIVDNLPIERWSNQHVTVRLNRILVEQFRRWWIILALSKIIWGISSKRLEITVWKILVRI